MIKQSLLFVMLLFITTNVLYAQNDTSSIKITKKHFTKYVLLHFGIELNIKNYWQKKPFLFYEKKVYSSYSSSSISTYQNEILVDWSHIVIARNPLINFSLDFYTKNGIQHSLRYQYSKLKNVWISGYYEFESKQASFKSFELEYGINYKLSTGLKDNFILTPTITYFNTMYSEYKYWHDDLHPFNFTNRNYNFKSDYLVISLYMGYRAKILKNKQAIEFGIMPSFFAVGHYASHCDFFRQTNYGSPTSEYYNDQNNSSKFFFKNLLLGNNGSTLNLYLKYILLKPKRIK